MKPFLSLAVVLSVVLLTSGSVPADDAAVELSKSGNTVEVTVGGEPFTTFNFGEELPKPFFHPVRGPGGTVLTREILTRPGSGDHPHQKGIWIAVDEVNGVDFWAEKGKIENQSVKLLVPKGNPAKLQVVNRWLAADGKPVVTEETTFSIRPNRVIAADIRFIAENQDVTFEDTKEGLFGFRMVNSMRENEGGKVVNADGLKGSRAAWGKPSAWVDYHGPVEGKTYGVAIFDHPENFRPSRYHVRNYGLFSINPFGERAYTGGKQEAKPVTIKKGGEPLRLRYAMYIHAGETEQANVADVYREYVKATRESK